MTADEAGASPPWCRRLIAEFLAAEERAVVLAQALTVEQLNFSPRKGAWSIGQCLDHLVVTNEVYLPPISRALAGRPRVVVEEIRLGLFGRWFIRNVIDPSSTARRRAPRKVVPSSRVDSGVLERLLAGNLEARAIILEARHCDVNRIRFANPFVPGLRFTVGTGFEILSRHQQRHLLQAERVRESANFAHGTD